MKTITDFPNYAITKTGKVWSKARIRPGTRSGKIRGQWLKSALMGSGYLGVTLCKNNKHFSCRIHSLVLETYIGRRPMKMQACHCNGDKHDNRLINLRWDTPLANMQDRDKHDKTARGERQGLSKLTKQKVCMIIYMWKTGLFSGKEIAKLYNITKYTVSDVVRRKTWKDLF